MPALLTSRLGSLRSFATATRRPIRNQVPEHQKIFQADDGLPVHLKRGVVDTWLYRFTMTATAFGTSYSLFSLIKAAFPKKNK